MVVMSCGSRCKVGRGAGQREFPHTADRRKGVRPSWPGSGGLVLRNGGFGQTLQHRPELLEILDYAAGGGEISLGQRCPPGVEANLRIIKSLGCIGSADEEAEGVEPGKQIIGCLQGFRSIGRVDGCREITVFT